MVKKYDYFIESVNPICNAKLRELFTKFAVPCVFYERFEFDVDKDGNLPEVDFSLLEKGSPVKIFSK